MSGKRHHYVPQFLLSRFAPNPDKPLLARLEKRTGRTRPANPVNEVVIGYYYRVVTPDGTVLTEADDALTIIEDLAAEVIPKLEAPGCLPNTDDILRLMLFIQSLKFGTPQYREALRESDKRAADLDLELALSDRELHHQTVSADGRSEEEIESERLELLADYKAGRLIVDSSPEREIALMARALSEDLTAVLLKSLGWTCGRVPGGSAEVFVCSDNPVSQYDPARPAPEAGTGFLSSPQAMTWVALDPRFGVLLTQDHPMKWQEIPADADDIKELNLLTYASARDAIYGPNQYAVTRVRELAKKNRALVSSFSYRPPRVWITQGTGEDVGPHTFTSRYKGHTATRTMNVSEDQITEIRRQARLPQKAG